MKNRIKNSGATWFLATLVYSALVFSGLVFSQSAWSARDPAEAIADSKSGVQASRPKTIVIGGSYSEDDAYAANAALGIPVGKSTELDFSLAYGSSPQELADLKTYRVGTNVDHDFDPIGVSIGYEYWGDRDFIDTFTWRGSLYLHGEAGRIALLADFRNIELSFDVPPGARGFVDSSKSVHSKGFGLSARLSGDRVDVYATGMHYDYNVEVGRLSSIVDLSRVPPALRPTIIQRLDTLVLQLRRLNANSLTLASNFLDYGLSAGIDVRFGARTLNFELSRDKTVTNGAVLNGAGVGFVHPLGKASDIEYRVGVSHDDDVGSSVYGGLTFYWYL